MAMIEPRRGSITRTRGGASSAVQIARVAITTLFGAIVAINLLAFVTELSPLPKTHLVAMVLAVYLLVESRIYLRRSDAFGLLSPAFLGLPFYFLLSYLQGITGFAFSPWVLERFTYWLADLDAALSETLLLAMLAAFCMLRGYALGQPLARPLRQSVYASRLFRREIRPIFGFVLTLQAVYLLLVAYAIQLGVYGLLSTPESMERHLSVVQYLRLSLAAGTLSYFLILLRYFELREQGRASALFGAFVVVLVAIHVLTGALAAFKSQVVYPFIIAGFASFIATRRIPLGFITAAVFALVAAYSTVEPLRDYLRVKGEPPASLGEAINALGTAYAMSDQLDHQSSISQGEAISARFDLTGMTALAVDYVNRGNLQEDKRREFQDSILLAPILAYVPRIAWTDKPTYSEGVWFNQNVRGDSRYDTSVAMGAVGYLYLAGGIVAVALGFLGLGIVQALIFDGLARGGAGGLIIFLSVASTLVMIPSSFGPALTGVLRMLPIAFVIQLILLRRSSPAW